VQRGLIAQVGRNAEADMRANFDYTEDNIKVLSDLFT